MSVYTKSTIDCFYYDDLPSDKGTPCEVRIDGKDIVVEYEYDGGRTIYKGYEVTHPAYLRAAG